MKNIILNNLDLIINSQYNPFRYLNTKSQQCCAQEERANQETKNSVADFSYASVCPWKMDREA